MRSPKRQRRNQHAGGLTGVKDLGGRGCLAAAALDTRARISLVTCCGRAALVINAVLCDRSTRPIRRVVRGCDGSARAARFRPGRADQRRHARRNYPKPVAQRRDAWRGGLARPRLPYQTRAGRGRPAVRRGARRSGDVTRPSRRPARAGDSGGDPAGRQQLCFTHQLWCIAGSTCPRCPSPRRQPVAGSSRDRPPPAARGQRRRHQRHRRQLGRGP